MTKRTIQKKNILRFGGFLFFTAVVIVAASNLLGVKALAQMMPIHISTGSLPSGASMQQQAGLTQAGGPQQGSPSSAQSSSSCTTSATATPPTPSGDLHGWLWSDMPDGSDQAINPNDQEGGRGFGWISVNGSDNPPLSSVAYKVTMSSTGALSGDAWTPNGGWLDFAPSGPYPTYGSPINVLPPMSARVDPACLASGGSSCAVTGWARFVAGEDANTQDTGGWDGWVNLSGHSYSAASTTPTVTSSFSVTYDANPSDANYGKFNGYAWGGTDAGWIGFGPQNGIGGAFITPPTPSLPLCTLTCVGTDGATYTYPATGPVPAICSPDGNLSCQGVGAYAGTTFYYPAGGTIPPECGDSPNPCNDPTAYNYGQSGTCTYDFCPVLIPGLQTQAQMTQTGGYLYNGTYYGLASNVCIQDACPDNPAYPATTGFQASIPTGYEVVNGVCQPKKQVPPNGKAPLSPIYKEN